MPRQIYLYELTVRVGREILTRQEHAYSPADAVMQIVFKLGGEGVSSEVKILSVGPPAADVRSSEVELARRLDQHMSGILDDLGPKHQLDVVGGTGGKVTVARKL